MLVRDIRYIIKRIIVGVGIALILSFLRGNLLLGVSALSFPAPTSVQVTNNNNSQSIYNGSASLIGWYGVSGYSGNGSPYHIQWNQGRFNFWYNGTLCQNKVVTAQVTTLMYSSETGIDFSNSLFRLKVYNGQSETACALNTLQQNSKVATWTCIFTNYNNSAFFVNNLTFYNNNFGIAIGNDSNYSCSPTTNDIIQSNQDQTNQIINNQNNNTTSIIQNNNSNTQAIVDSQQDINNTLNDSNVDSASSQASNFFGSFTSNSHGLSGIITAPLRLIQSLSTATCNPLEFDLPFVEEHVVLPCMRGIYENYFGVFFSLWQLITTGVISYNICINLYSKVRNLQNPNNDRIEVLNL